MILDRVGPDQPGWAGVLGFLAAHADPIRDMLLFADVRSDLGRLSTVWHAPGRGVAFSFPLDPARPALGVKGVSAADEAAIVAALAAAGAWTSGYVICSPGQRPMWAARGTAQPGHREKHMLIAGRDWQAPPPHPAVREAGFAEVDAFMRETGAGAWHPAQFETGPYVVAEEGGTIVAAAGTHFAYAELGHLGNVMTRPEARGRGWATACTAAIATRLAARGHGMLSLLVASGNAPAVRVYEKLGFRTLREVEAFAWDA